MADNPKWKPQAVADAAKQMINLLNKRGDPLLAVLPPGAKEGLIADTNELVGVTMTTSVAQKHAMDATADQAKLLSDGGLQIWSWLDAIRKTYPADKPMQKFFKVGTRYSPNSVRSVATMMKNLLDAAAARPEAAREAAILPAHVEKMNATLEALMGADSIQGEKKQDSKEAFKQRRATQVRVERMLLRIVAAATMTYMGKPEAEEFAAVLPRPARSKKPRTASGS